MKVVMIGADRSVKGGVSAVVNNLYAAGLDQKVKLTYIGTMVDGSKVRKALQAVIALSRFFAAVPSADLVHVNMAADASCFRKMLFIKIAVMWKKKIVIHEHGGDFQGFYYERCSEKSRKKVRRALNQADVFLVLSQEWKAFFARIVEPEKIVVMQNAVALQKAIKTNYESHRVLFLGRLCKEKGVGELLDSVPAIREQIPDFQLILGGFWEEGTEALQRKAEGLSDVVRCPGWVTGQEKEKLFEACSIFVLPTWFEGQPVSLLEAMAQGLCVAASEVGGIPEILAADEKGRRPGVLLPPRNAEALAESLISLLRDESVRREYGQYARDRIQEQYDINRYVEKLLSTYEEVLVQKR